MKKNKENESQKSFSKVFINWEIATYGKLPKKAYK